jgi:small subunit ribosomal protein S1
VRKFEVPPAIGDEHDFTLRGLEEGLWSLALAVQPEAVHVRWEELEIGSVVQARAIRVAPGGLEMKIGPLHAFLPKSQAGLPRDARIDVLVGKSLTCEVIEVDTERARVTVSRKVVLLRERESEHQRLVDRLKVGEIVQGRVTRIEEFGAFVAFGRGMEGLVHVSNMAHEHVGDPRDVVKMGEVLTLKVLHVKRGGKRIGLGLKQVGESPWRDLDKTLYAGAMLEGVVTRVFDFGAFVTVRRGIEGLVPASEAGLRRDQRVGAVLKAGQRVSARVLSFDVERERLSLSLMHPNGVRIEADEAANQVSFEEIVRGEGLARPLGDLLRKAVE